MSLLKAPGSHVWSGQGNPSNYGNFGVNGEDYQDTTSSDHYTKILGLWVKRGAINVSLPLSYDQNTSALTLPMATGSASGYLSTSDWNAFNTKVGVYYHYAVENNVVEQDIVMNLIDNGSGQAPLKFKQAVNGGNSYYPAIYGVAKNVSGGFADIYIGKGVVVPGFSFGAFIGVEYYIDPSNPGKLTWTPPATGSSVNPIKVGRALDSTHLILDPVGNFLQLKGSLYVSDGSYDDSINPGVDGQVLVCDSTQTYGLKFAPSIVVAAPFTYTSATRTLTVATSTNSVAGVLSAADHITFAGYAATIALKSPLASPTFTGDVSSSTGNVLVSTIGKGIQVKTGANSKIGTAVLVAGTVTVTNTSVTANSRILVTSQTDGGTPGFLRVSTKTAGASFVIKSSSTTDTSTVAWYIVESIP